MQEDSAVIASRDRPSKEQDETESNPDGVCEAV
jgi:hypothetical protein